MMQSAAMLSASELALLAAALLLAYLALVAVLAVAARNVPARELLRFAPDCLILVKRLAGDSRVARRHKLVLVLLVAYLISPIDLIPDFLPGIGQVDDVLVLGLALRFVLRRSGPELIAEQWPGSPEALTLLLRLIGMPAARVEPG